MEIQKQKRRCFRLSLLSCCEQLVEALCITYNCPPVKLYEASLKSRYRNSQNLRPTQVRLYCKLSGTQILPNWWYEKLWKWTFNLRPSQGKTFALTTGFKLEDVERCCFFLKSSRFSRWKILITTIYVQFSLLMRTPKRRVALGNLNIMPILGTFGTGPHWALCKKTLTLILTPDCKWCPLNCQHISSFNLYIFMFSRVSTQFPAASGLSTGMPDTKGR